MARTFFHKIQTISYEGSGSTNPLAFKHYNPAEIVNGKTMQEEMRFSISKWTRAHAGGLTGFLRA